MSNLRKMNMVSGRGQEQINFTSLGVGSHSKSVYNRINRMVLQCKNNCVINQVLERLLEIVWTKQLGTVADDISSAIAIDSNNNVYITGYTGGALVGTSAGLKDAFLVKYNSAGISLWTKQLGTTSNDYSRAVAIDSNNNVYITGYTEGALVGTSAGTIDAFLVKYNSVGTSLWTKQLGTTANDITSAIAIDSNNNVYISGYTTGSLVGTNAGSIDAFLVKYG